MTAAARAARKVRYQAERNPLEKARDYLNSRFPFSKAESGLEVFERVAAIMAPESKDEAGMDFARFVAEGITPPYLDLWNERAEEDYLHRPITEK
ncbi:MAG TPA: hypothetical protein VNU25_00210 [Candidatus Paceibacterota bacterium]|nr:hypothetical protein [Candidatus Paceibacterota bacterium]